MAQQTQPATKEAKAAPAQPPTQPEAAAQVILNEGTDAGSKGKEGEGKEGATVALTVLFGPIGLIKHGKNVEIKNGTPLLAYLDENYSVHIAK